MEQQAVWALAIFLIVYAFIISGTIHRTVLASAGAVLLAVFGIADQTVIQHIDLGTLGLLAGMMVMINVTAEAGFFRFVAVWAAQKAKAGPIRLLILLTFITAFCSAFLNNALTVLFMIPVILNIARQLRISPIPYLAAQVAASSAGGMATLVGSATNIMIGNAVEGLGFLSFILHMAPIAAIILLAYMLIIILLFRKQLKTAPEMRSNLMRMNPSDLISDRNLLIKCMAVTCLTIAGFFLHELIGLEPAVIALAGAVLLLLITGERVTMSAFSRAEWAMILFFAATFVIVSALVDTGVITQLAELAINWTSGHTAWAAMLILWISAITSAFTDNIPLVAAMIPLIQEMGEMGTVNLAPLWWSLALGAGLGGNGSLIGSGAGLVMASMAAKDGHVIRFIPYLKRAFPLMILSVALSSGYIYLRYLL